MISTEALLTSPEAFGIATATPAQRAICRVLDGAPLAELADHPDVLELIGGPEALSALPSQRGTMPIECIVLAAIRTAKTIIALAAGTRMAQTVDDSRLGRGEVPRVSLVSLKLDTAAVMHRLLLETLQGSSVLRALLLDHSADTITVRHPSGRPIEIACVAGSKAGGGLVARWSAGVIFDEAPRMDGASDAVVNLEHARTAVLGRLLPGAQVLYIGSPWAPHGPIYDLVNERWRKPTANMVVLRGNGPMLNPKWWTAKRCERLREQDPIAYQTDVCGEFADPESGLLNPIAVQRNTREAPLELPYEQGRRYIAATDPSEGSAHGNAWTLVIVQRTTERLPGALHPRVRNRVALAREWRGVRPEQCIAEIAAACLRYGLRRAVTDQYAAEANRALARLYGLTLDIRRTTASSKIEDFTNLQTLIHTDSVELPPDRQLRRDLLSVRKRVTQQGVTIVLPKTGDGRHCDYAPALAAAVAGASRSQSRDLSVVGVHNCRGQDDRPHRIGG